MMTSWMICLVGYAVTSRLAYVLWVGRTLRQQDRAGTALPGPAADAAFDSFRRRSQILMRNDVIAFIAVCVLTHGTLAFHLPVPLLVAGSAALILIGSGTKYWAMKTLGGNAYYWHNFFVAGEHAAPDPPGPYRYLSNPMYTVGYLHAYGLALLLSSGPGLALALFDQAAILIFHRLVERPHYRRLVTAAGSSPASSRAGAR
jgi:protein-S-isoprenylcysteine O-methyltransferase Ste14